MSDYVIKFKCVFLKDQSTKIPKFIGKLQEKSGFLKTENWMRILHFIASTFPTGETLKIKGNPH